MGVFTNKKHTSSLYKVVKNSQRSEPMVTHGKSKQSKETSRGDREYNPALQRRSDQGLNIRSTIDQMIAKAVGKGA